MPCSSGYEPHNYDELERVTKIACELARMIRYESENNHECSYLFANLSKKAQKWILAHEKLDKEREEREKTERRAKKLRRRALKKLSKKEIEALGIRR